MDTTASNSLGNIASLVAAPAPLQPSTFDPATDPAATASTELDLVSDDVATSSTSGPLGSKDRVTLLAMLDGIRTARADAKSADQAKAKAAAWQITYSLSYLAGFFDGKGPFVPTSPNPGFLSVTGEAGKPTLDDSLDALDAAISQILVPADTRAVNRQKILEDQLGTAAIAIGVGLLVGPAGIPAVAAALLV